MYSTLKSLFGLIVSFISKLTSSLFGRSEVQEDKNNGSRYEAEADEGDCGNCSRCVALRRKRLEEKCALVENYITNNLLLYEQLEQIIQLQTLNITRQLNLLKNLNCSGEYLKAAINDCVEKHVSCVSQFTQEMERLQINQKAEESVAIIRSEQSIADFKRNLIGSVVRNEQRSITELLQQ